MAQMVESVCNAGDLGSIPGSGRSPGEGKGHPLQYSCLENSMDRGACRATVQGVAKSKTRLSDSLSLSHTHTHTDTREEEEGKSISGSTSPTNTVL